MTKVKICGIQDLETALVAAQAGADFLGFVFVPGVHRRMSDEDAQELIERLRESRWRSCPTLVGVFADQPADEVNRIAKHVNLDAVQLSGCEEMSYCAQIDKPIIKAIHVRGDQPGVVALPRVTTVLDWYNRAGHVGMLDCYSDLQTGGTGVAFDWSIACDLSGSFQFLLAGGLTPENVGQAVREVAPWGVDVSSGVEKDGRKDAQRIRDFIQAVRAADLRPKQTGGLLARLRNLSGDR